MPDHAERHHPQITDEDVLARIKDGTLVVDVNKPSVRSFANKRWRTIRVVERSSNRSPTYRFVEIYRNAGRKKVALHRIVWMAAYLAVPPPWCDVHHKKHRKRNPDAIDNLELLTSHDNRRTNAKADDEW